MSEAPMMLTREQVEKIAHIMWEEGLPRSSEEILANDAALRARVQELEQSEDHYQKTILGLDDKILALTAKVEEFSLRRRETVAMCDQLQQELARVTGERDLYKASMEERINDLAAAQDDLRSRTEDWQLSEKLLHAAQAREGRLKRIAVAFYDDIGLSDDDRKWWYENYADIKTCAALTEPTSS